MDLGIKRRFDKMIDSLDYYWRFDLNTRSILNLVYYTSVPSYNKLRRLTELLELSDDYR